MKIRVFFLCVAVAGLGYRAGWGQGAAGARDAGKRPMTFEDLQKMRRVSDPQVSPSGKWVMFSVTEVSLEKNTKVNHLWVVPVRGGAEVQVTSGEGESNGRFSPDGRSVSWTAGDQIVVAHWDEAAGKPGAGLTLTQVSTGADGAIWSPDSKRLLFVSSVYPECSDKWSWAEENACNKAKDDAAAKSPVKAQVWDHLLFRHWDHFTGQKRSHVMVVDATYGASVRDLTPAKVVGDAETPTFTVGGPLGYAWAPDSKEIAYVTNLDPVPAASTNNDVFMLRLDEQGAKAVKVSTSPGSDDAPAYSPDGKWLAFRTQAKAGYESDRFRLAIYDRKEGTVRELDLSQEDSSRSGKPVEVDLDRWVDEFFWSHDAQRIFFVAGDRGEEVIYGLNFSSEELHRFGRTPGVWGSLVQAGLEYKLVGTLTRVDQPTEIALADLQKMDDGPAAAVLSPSKAGVGKASARRAGANRAGAAKVVSPRSGADLRVESEPEPPIFLTHLNDAVLASLELTRLESYWFTAADGVKVEGFVLRPPKFDETKTYPVKFLIHGGPESAWENAWSYRWNLELMAASGYVVVMVNPRGSTGYGQAFIDGINGDWGGKPYLDLMKGLDAAEAKYPFLDKTRECALGASYGGFMANWVLTHTNRFQCIVTHDGMFDPASAYGTTEELWFNEWEFRRPKDTKPAQPWRYDALPVAEDPFRRWSPMLSIQKAKTPTLVIHSQKDYRLDVSEGLQLFTALQRLGVPSRMLYFPDEGHWILKPQNSQLWYETVGDWCDRWTKSGKYAEGMK
ncbi:S9 family peptidase [Granulicella sp. dw_53]|uniref:dipeptidyl-peptidase 5 n=1 Tax=Granulicella sp. dw_53 TaxID=2719792 RepID=UPI001BD5EB0A|nr:S9 family peptidase [Granulicella sp. dw_53]